MLYKLNMKEIILSSLILFCFSVQAQHYIKVLDKATLQETYIPYVPGVTNVTGVTKAELDAAVGNRALQSFVNNAINNLQNVLATKANIGSGGTIYGNVVSLPQETYVTEIRTLDYGKTYSNGKTIGAYYGQGYEHSPGINFVPDIPDNIYQVASYNITPKGTRITNDAGWWFGRTERHYDISPSLKEAFEPHVWGFQDYTGQSHRSLSGYFSKIDGKGFWAMKANVFKIDSYMGGGVSKDLFSVSDGSLTLHNTNNQLKFGMHHSNGANFTIDLTGGGFDIIGNSIQISNSKALRLPIKDINGNVNTMELYVDANGFVKAR